VAEIKALKADVRRIIDRKRRGGEASGVARANKQWHRHANEVAPPLLEANSGISSADLGREIWRSLERHKINDRPADLLTVVKYATKLKEAWLRSRSPSRS
jgi:hypothetical protein